MWTCTVELGFPLEVTPHKCLQEELNPLETATSGTPIMGRIMLACKLLQWPLCSCGKYPTVPIELVGRCALKFSDRKCKNRTVQGTG
jgi:hypothetical protein